MSQSVDNFYILVNEAHMTNLTDGDRVRFV